MDRKKLIKRLLYLIFFIFIFNFLANKFYWYSSLWYLDMIMHFLGGFWLGLLFIWFSRESFRLSLESKDLSWAVLKMLLFVFFVGIGWEVFEMLVNDVIAKNPFDFVDSISDIFFDLSGGLCAILYVWKTLQKKQSE